MGCGTSTSSNGVVGGHAYSILEVVELGVEDYAGAVNLQSSVRNFFTNPSSSSSSSSEGVGEMVGARALSHSLVTELELEAKQNKQIRRN